MVCLGGPRRRELTWEHPDTCQSPSRKEHLVVHSLMVWPYVTSLEKAFSPERVQEMPNV